MKPKTKLSGKLSRFAGAAVVISGMLAWSGCEKDYYYIAPPPTQPVSLSSDIQPIFDANCIGCHDGTGLDPDLRAGFSHASLWSTGDIDTLNPANSVLYSRISRPSSSSGAMPPGGPQLSGTEQALVLKWIEEGAKDN